MSLAIKSIWRARSRCSAFSGPFPKSRAPLPSRISNPYAIRLESTTAYSDGTNSTEPPETALVALPEKSLEVSEQQPEQVIANLVTDDTHESRNRAFKDAFRIDAPRLVEDKDAMKLF